VREDERERITRARQAAEALFTTRPQAQQSGPDSVPSEREPRVLRAIAPVTVHSEERKSVIESEQRITLEIPSSQVARIRAWVKYGMSAAQVAAVYGVAVDVIEHILAQA
jgi:hypothetical protein